MTSPGNAGASTAVVGFGRCESFKPATKESNMAVNKDQIKGALKDIGGKIQQEAGKLVGSTDQQVKGLKNQARGKAQKNAGDLKEATSDVKKAAKK